MEVFEAIVTDADETHWVFAGRKEFYGLTQGRVAECEVRGVEKCGLLRAAVLTEDTTTGATVLMEEGLSDQVRG